MGARWPDAEASDDKPTKEQPEIGAREDPSGLELQGTLGAIARSRRGALPSGFPHHGEQFIISHLFTIIPTANGAASAAAAHSRIETAEGGTIIQD